MNCDEIVSGLILEFRRGTLIMVVLAQLNKPMYGYSLVKELEGKGISIEGNTLYPLLRRLESQGLLKSEWETEATKPRKYYIITEDGKLVYKKIKEHWKKFSQSINVLKELEGKGISIEGNTLYPLLRRLESQGLLKSEWETEATKPRKYYIITEDGKLVYKKIKEHWKKFSQSINVLMEEE